MFFLLCVFTFLDSCCDGRYNVRIKILFGSALPQVVCKRAHVLCVICACSGVQHIVLFVFVLCLVYPMLPVSLDCPFLIALSVSLTFIYLKLSFYTKLCIVHENVLEALVVSKVF